MTGEAIRPGDFYDMSPVGGGLMEFDAYFGSILDEQWPYRCYRKARTEGCPPGWRWADAGEAPSHWLFPEGVLPRANRNRATRVPHDSTKMGDNDGYVMPYPEDPRLEE